MKRKPRFFFAFRSPYAWMASRLLEQRFPQAPEQIDYIPFWEPDPITADKLQALGGEMIYTTMSRQKHLYILQDTRRLTAKFGFTMQWPVDKAPWWDLPHLAYLMARRLGKGHEFFWAIYQARWERAENICDREIIRKAAESVGLDGHLIAAAPEDEEIRAEGAEALYQCYQSGVFGVPFFTVGFDKFWGVDRLEDFAVVFERQIRETWGTEETSSWTRRRPK